MTPGVQIRINNMQQDFQARLEKIRTEIFVFTINLELMRIKISKKNTPRIGMHTQAKIDPMLTREQMLKTQESKTIEMKTKTLTSNSSRK